MMRRINDWLWGILLNCTFAERNARLSLAIMEGDMRAITVSIVALALAGCVNTAEVRQRVAADDDAYCARLGAQRGSSGYVACRLARDERRARASEAQADALRAIGRQMMQGGPAPQPAPMMRPTNCTSSWAGRNWVTHCF